MKTKLIDAAEIYRARQRGKDGNDIAVDLDDNGVQAVMRKDGILVIEGTNELQDWLEFNLPVFREAPEAVRGFGLSQGASGATWHAGFLDHARVVYAFAKPQRPKLIIGHSLGAASAQIVGSSLGVPTIAFAAPSTIIASSRIKNEGWVVNINRVDDAICYVPGRLFGFRHVGHMHWIGPMGINPGEDHQIDNYIDLLKEDRVAQALPPHWPSFG